MSNGFISVIRSLICFIYCNLNKYTEGTRSCFAVSLSNLQSIPHCLLGHIISLTPTSLPSSKKYENAELSMNDPDGFFYLRPFKGKEFGWEKIKATPGATGQRASEHCSGQILCGPIFGNLAIENIKQNLVTLTTSENQQEINTSLIKNPAQSFLLLDSKQFPFAARIEPSPKKTRKGRVVFLSPAFNIICPQS